MAGTLDELIEYYLGSTMVEQMDNGSGPSWADWRDLLPVGTLDTKLDSTMAEM